MAEQNQELKQKVYEKARELGADLIGCCSVSKWEEQPMQEKSFWPQSIWPWAQNVIVMGIPLMLPMMETSPSMVYQELYDTTNRVLDELAYRVTAYLNKLGYRAAYFPRDGYYNVNVLLDEPKAAFSHVIAGYYAGLGTIGASHNLLTKEYGPRIRIVSVITDAPLEPDRMMERDLCVYCRKCLRSCPAGCFQGIGLGIFEYDAVRCTEYHCKLVEEHHWPCGICATVCPIGDDRKIYQGEKIVTEEGKAHCGKYGS